MQLNTKKAHNKIVLYYLSHRCPAYCNHRLFYHQKTNLK